MASNIQMPADLTDIIKVEQNTEVLRQFLTELVNKLKNIEDRIEVIEEKLNIGN